MNIKLLLIITTLGYCMQFSVATMGQNFKMEQYHLSENYVNGDFKVSPNNQFLAYSTMFFTETGFDVGVFVKDLKNDTTPIELPQKMMIHSWLDNENLMLGSEEVNEYYIVNIQTLEADTIEGISEDAILVKKNTTEAIYFQDIDTALYIIEKNGNTRQFAQPPFTGTLYYCKNTDEIYELHFMNKDKKCYTQVYSYHPNKNERKQVARIRMLTNDEDSYIEHIRLYDGKFYFIESIFTTAIKYKLSFLVSYDIKTKRRKTMYAFEKGLDCQNMEVLSDEQFLVLIKDNKKVDNIKDLEVEDAEVGFDFSAELMLLKKKSK